MSEAQDLQLVGLGAPLLTDDGPLQPVTDGDWDVNDGYPDDQWVGGGSTPREVSHTCANSHFQDLESLDYDHIVNTFSRSDVKNNGLKRSVFGYTGKTLTRWVLALLTGILCGVCAYVISQVKAFIVNSRHSLLFELPEDGGDMVPSGANCVAVTLFNMFLALIAGLAVTYVAPRAAGSGIPEVKAYLNGVHIPQHLSMRTLIVKIVGTILGVASGLAMGQEGPLVHIGAIIGSGLTRGHKRISIPCLGIDRRFKWGMGMKFRNDSDRRGAPSTRP
jgi:chloride channel 7